MKPEESSKVYGSTFGGRWRETIDGLLDAAKLSEALKGQKTVLIKPNLVEAQQPPITTPVELVAAIVDYIRERVSGIDIIVGDGTGSLEYDTHHAFRTLGYSAMAAKKGVRLLDLNEEPSIRLSDPRCSRWPEMFLPEVAMESYLLSVPVLKAHSLAGVTLTMKNMMGICPPEYYHKGGHWKKAAFHARIHEAILDLNRYRAADFTLIDATVGMSEAHLWGPTCDPHPNLLIAGYDPVAVDAYGCGVLGRDWRKVGHIAMAHGELGCAEPLEVVKVKPLEIRTSAC
ncbi:MAG: DUF362 domain-containing protein [Nitrospirota bacterium]|nr:DUF362 domain-containing protein [Nitrospirota bacterium]